jgi:molybdate transport system regulatory protein
LYLVEYNAIDSRVTPSPDAAMLPSAPPAPTLWFRVLLPGGALGPGKITLMRAIAAAGSVSAAAKSLKMSHARSVKLVAEINALAPTPLIDTRAGGPSGGGAQLTPLGLAVLDAHAGLDAAVREAAAPALDRLMALLAG